MELNYNDIQVAALISLVECDLLCADIGLANNIENIVKYEKEKLPFHLNVISSVLTSRLRETGHSRLLADMLRHSALQLSFLKQMLNVEFDKPLKVYREIGDTNSRIDVLLTNGTDYVIVENKVNGAEETENQLYRYVYDLDIGIPHSLEHTYIIYLNPNYNAMPSEQSYTKNGKSVLNDIPNKGDNARFVVKNYAYDILPWLKQLDFTAKPLDKEPLLQSAVMQYIDYLEEYFQLLDKYDHMNKEIKNKILESYGLLDENDNKRIIDVLSERKTNMEQLLRYVNEIISEKTIDSTLNDIADKLKQQYPDYSSNVEVELGGNYPKTIITLPYKDEKPKLAIAITRTNGNIYYGVYCNEREKCYTKLNAEFTPFLYSDNETPQKSEKWPVWRYTSYDTVIFDFIQLIDKTLGI